MKKAPNHDRLLKTSEAAELLNVTPQTLRIWRSRKQHSLPFIRVGGSIRYRLSALENWLAKRTNDSSEDGNVHDAHSPE